jgi:2-oxoglutarate dehydrogenase dihydrolipoamide succinyltransferase (E2 component)
VSSSPTETLTEVTMPQMGISVAEGTILEWRKRPGDWVEADETICDVTTDKVDVEIPAPASGRVQSLLAEPGETIAVGEAIATIDTAAKPGEAHPEEHKDAGPVAGDALPPPDQRAAESGPPAPTAEEPSESDRSRFYSPVVRRIAEKHRVDLAQVQGTGIGGRVRKKDVLAHIELQGAPGPEPAPETAPAERPERPLHIESPYRPEPAAGQLQPATAGAGDGAEPETVGLSGPERREPMPPMRQQIARHMVESRRTSAHCTTVVEVDLSRVAARRLELKEPMARRGVRLTYLAFVARATVSALQEHPVLNASIDGDELVYHEDVNLGIAVALEDGLIVPVIRKAQRLSLEGIAAAINDVADRARQRKLEPDDVHGGTFTITNPGQFGAVLATPIINQPQVAILDLEAVVKRPVAIESEDGDAIAVRPMTYLCMSWDHRALDGALAARFLGRVKERLEGWEEDR